MKPLSYSLIAAALACGFASAQTTAYTTPVGYVSLGDTTAGQPAIKANTDVFISIPLSQPTVAQGLISVKSGLGTVGDPYVLTIPNVTLGDLTTVPHTIRIASGAAQGLIGLIIANTATTVTVTVQLGDNLAGVVAGTDSVSISKAWTVLGLMGATMPVGTFLFTFPASGVQNASSDGIYEWDGTNWIDNVNTGGPADADVLYPNETLVVRNQAATPIASFVVTGEVPLTNSRVAIAASSAAGADNAISYFSPVDEPIGGAGLTTLAQPGDFIFGYDNNAAGYNKAASSIHEFDGTDWLDNVNTGAPDPAYPLGGGRGYVFRRSGTAPAAVWTDKPIYVVP